MPSDNMFKLLWDITVPYDIFETQIFSGDRIVISSSDGDISVFEMDGNRIHNFDSKLKNPRIREIDDDRMLIFSDNVLTSFRINGEKLWSHSAGKVVNCAAVTPRTGNIIASSDDRYLYIISPDGQIIQKHRSTYPFNAVSISARTGMIAASSDVGLYILSPEGEIKWTYKLRWKISALSLSPRGNIIITGALTNIYCFDPQQRIKWKDQMDSMPLMMAVPDNEKRVYVALKSAALSSLDSLKGNEYWRYNAPGNPKNLSIDTNGNYIIYTTEGEETSAAQVLTSGGKLLKKMEFSDPVTGVISPDASIVALGSGTSIMVFENQHLYKLKLTSLKANLSNFESLDLDLNAPAMKLDEAKMEFDSGNIEEGTKLIKEAEKDIDSTLEGYVSEELPELESECDELSSILSGSATASKQIERLEKIRTTVRKKLDENAYGAVLKLIMKSHEIIPELRKEADRIKIQIKSTEFTNILNEVKVQLNELRNMGIDVDGLETETNEVEAFISMGRMNEGAEKLSTLKEKVSSFLEEKRREEANKLVDRISNYVDSGREKGIEVFDMEALLKHAITAAETSNLDIISDYLNEVERIYKKRTKMQDPELISISNRIKELKAHISELENSGIILNPATDSLNEAESILESDREKANSLVNRTENELESIEKLSSELTDMIRSIDDFLTQMPEPLHSEITNQLEEIKFSMASGDIKRAWSRANSIVRKIDKMDIEGLSASTTLCPNCGATVKEGSIFCGKCGTPISGFEPTDICPNCGVVLEEEDRYCPKCGRRLR